MPSFRTLLIVLVLCTALAGGLFPAAAQNEADAWLLYPLNLRAGPAQTDPALVSLAPGTGLILEARSGDAAWLLGRTEDGGARGWVPAAFVFYRDGFDPANLPSSTERVSRPGASQGEPLEPDVVDLAAAAPDFIRTRAAAVDLAAYPIIPPSVGQARAIFERGQAVGRLPNVISKVGDCNSTEWLFLYPFGEGQYDLGAYADLQGVVDTFGASFASRTYAAHNGLNVASVLDPTWADPSACQPGESPLACELRNHNPSVAIVMFGSNDILVLTTEQFDTSLRRLVTESIQAGVIPLLSTFPRYLSYPDRSILFNQIIVQVALDYDLPLVNLWLALEPLPAHGIAEDGYHLNGPLTRAGDLRNAQNLQTGYPVRNLVTLQALDVIWREVIQGDE